MPTSNKRPLGDVVQEDEKARDERREAEKIKKAKQRAAEKDRGESRPQLVQAKKALEAELKACKRELAGIKRAQPEAAQLHKEVEDTTAAMAAVEERLKRAAIRTPATLTIVQVAASAKLDRSVDVANYALATEAAEASKVTVKKGEVLQQEALVFTFQRDAGAPSATVNVFKNGRIVVPNAPSELQALQAVCMAADLIEDGFLDTLAVMRSFKITSRQAKHEARTPILNLEQLKEAIKSRVTTSVGYNPELYPAVHIRMFSGGNGMQHVQLEVFPTGCILVTGNQTATFDNMLKAFQLTFPMIQWSTQAAAA